MILKPVHFAAAALLAVALAGGGYYAGVSMASRGTSDGAAASPAGQAAARRQAGGTAGVGGVAAGNRAVNGRILSVNADSITVQVRDPGQGPGASPSTGSTIVLVGPTTRVLRTQEQEIALADLKAGDQVTIVGAPDPSGVVSATAIVSGGLTLQQILGGGGGARPAASPSPTRR